MDRIQNSAIEEEENEELPVAQPDSDEATVVAAESGKLPTETPVTGDDSTSQQQRAQPNHSSGGDTRKNGNPKATKRRSTPPASAPAPERVVPARDNRIIETGYEFKYPHEKYSKAANWRDFGDSDTDPEWHWKSHVRARRAARQKEDYRNTCSLYIQTDPLLWNHIRDSIIGVSMARKSRMRTGWVVGIER